MRKLSIFFLIIGSVLTAVSFLLPPVVQKFTPDAVRVGIIGGADAPTYMLIFKLYSFPFLYFGLSLMIASFILYLIWRKKK